MSEVGTPPPHNLYKPHVLVASINKSKKVERVLYIKLFFVYIKTKYIEPLKQNHLYLKGYIYIYEIKHQSNW